MSEHFRIGELAKLRNITKRALRYYEDLGLLVPSPGKDTNTYHYYHEGQLTTLDIIQFCSQIGINLKNLAPYVKENGVLDYAGIQKLCREHVDMQLKHFENMKLLLNDMALFTESCNQHRCESDGYIRWIIPRTIIYQKLDSWKNFYNNQSEVTRLYAYCEEHDILHTYTYGIIQDIKDGQTDYYMYTQILNEDFDAPNIMHLPGGDYLCFQDDTRRMDIPECFLSQLNRNRQKMIVCSSMRFDQMDLEHPVWEKQIFME